jgi:hypothetical protein
MPSFTLGELLNQITPERANQWLAGKTDSLTGNPDMDNFLDDAQHDQEIWDATVLCAFESTTGKDGVLEDEAFQAWLENDPAALPAIAALKSAREGVWISPQDYNEAAIFWRAAARDLDAYIESQKTEAMQ